MALRKVCVRDFGALVVRRFAYAKTGCVRDSRRREKSRSRTQIAYANRSCVRDFQWRISADFLKIAYAKSRTQIASRTQNRVELGAIYVRDSRFAYAIFAGILLSVICVH